MHTKMWFFNNVKYMMKEHLRKYHFEVNQSRFTRYINYLLIYILSDNKNGSLPRWLCSSKKGRGCYKYNAIHRSL